MTSKFNKALSENLALPEDAKEQIQEAWNEQLTEAREVIAAELREEFAQKFEYDKGVLVEAMDKFLNDKVNAEMSEFAQDKKDLVAERVKYKTLIGQHTTMLDQFVTGAIAKEVKELREDRKSAKDSVAKLEGFLMQQLSEEIKEFHSDKQQLVQQKVKMVREGKQALVETKRGFVTKAAKLVESKIDQVLRTEIHQYRDDIIAARETDFGRRIFESFVAEYMTSYLNEGSEVKKLQSMLESKQAEISTLSESVTNKEALTESVKTKLSAANDRIERNKVMADLLAPLGREKRDVMKELLESVKTAKLSTAFNKYLPAVLNETAPRRAAVDKTATLNESRVEKTGDRATVAHDSSAIELDSLRKLAGL